MAKQLNVNLAFTADTNKAKAQLRDLQGQLTSLMQSSTVNAGGLGIDAELMKAIQSANQLKSILKESTASTGALDLGQFNQNLKKSGKTLQDYANDLNSLGPTGQQAFATIAQSITTAGVPLKRTNALLNEFATTLKNTARWQISSSILHGFMGSVQSAYGYAQDLNKSLNNIRIVTGQNSDQMAKFAAQANKAAKALSSTTTEYTDAALIYYQQGLTDEQVQKRTDITIKMANVTGETSQEVSDQMTAIWNNFDDGSRSLEHYADVLTALGAATASSTDEISAGLEKFASIADMIGLSYENAAAALATVTATTRQSADVVGTAFKTIFARIQGLNLGETMDDGTTLNKYSAALEKVGINIKDQQGDLKDMDDILNEMGARWESLSKDQQVALAQSVAGVRQYNQLVSLMDNWSYFQQNLTIANTSEGALQKQADTYAESWEAAQDRVKAALEEIYGELLNDDFFITVLDGFEKFISAVGGLMKGLGGLPGVLLLIGTVATKVFGTQIADSIDKAFYNLTYNSEKAKDEILKTRKDAISAMKSLGDETIAGSAAVDIFSAQGKLQDKLLAKTQELQIANTELTNSEQQQAQSILDITNNLGQELLKTAQLRQEQEAITSSMTSRVKQVSMGLVKDEDLTKLKEMQTSYTALTPLIEAAQNEMAQANKAGTDEAKAKAVDRVRIAFQNLQKTLNQTGISFDGLEKETQTALNSLFELDGVDFDTLNSRVTAAGDQVDALGADAQKAFNNIRRALSGLEGIDQTAMTQSLNELQASLTTTGRLTAQQAEQDRNLGVAIEETGNIIDSFSGRQTTLSERFVALTGAITGVAMGISMIKGLGDIWNDDDASTGEKILNTITTLGMAIPMFTSALSLANIEKIKGIPLSIATALGYTAEAAAAGGATVATTLLGAAIKFLMGPVGWAILAITALVGVVILLANAHNAESDAAKRSAAQVESLTDRYAELQDQAQAFKDTVSNYDTAVDALADLEEGTEEYRTALQKANDEAKNLIETYGLFDQYTMEDGLIKINDQALALKQQENAIKMAQAETQLYSAQIQNTQAQLKLSASQTAKDIGYKASYSYATEGGMVTGAREFSSGELLAVSTALSGLEDAAAMSDEKLTSALMSMDSLPEVVKDNISAIVENKDELLNLSDSIKEASAANDYYAKQIMSNIVEQQYGEEFTKIATGENQEVNTQIYDELVAAATERATEAQEAQNNTLKDAIEQIDVSKVKSTGDLKKYEQYADVGNDEELAMRYAQDILNLDTSALEYKGGTGKGTLKDQSGTAVLDEVNDEFMRQQLARKAQIDELTAKYQESMGGASEEQYTQALGDMVSGAQSMGEKYGGDFTNALLTSLANGAQSIDLSNIYTKLSPSEYEELFQLADSPEALAEALGLTTDQIAALGYNSASDFAIAFKEGLSGWDVSDYIAATNAEGEAKAEDLGLDVNEFKEYRDLLKDTNKEYEDNVEGLNEVALANKRMEKGVSSLASNWEDWNDIMTDSDSSIEDISTILPDVNAAIQDILNLDTDQFSLLPNDFAQKNWKLIDDATNGVEGAIDELRNKAGEEILLTVAGVLESSQLNEDVVALNQQIASYDIADFTVGVALDPTQQADFYAACQGIVDAAGMTAEQAQGYFKSMGYDVEFNEGESVKTSTYQVPNVVLDPETKMPSLVDPGNPTIDITTTNRVAGTSIKTITPTGSYGGGLGVKTTAPKTATAPRTGGGGGGGGKSQKKDTKKLDDERERYHEINAIIEDLTNSLDALSRAKDRAWGLDKLKYIDAEIAKIQQLIEAQKQYVGEIQANLSADKSAIAGYGAQFDANGNISNYDTIVAQQVSKYNEAVNAFNKNQNKDTFEAAEKAYEEFKKVLEKYEETNNLFQAAQQELQDRILEELDKKLEKIKESVSMKISIRDDDIEYLEYQLGRLEDQAFSTAQALALITTNVQALMDQSDFYSQGIAEILAIRDAGGSLTSDQIDTLRDYKSSLIDINNQLLELKKTMEESVIDSIEEFTDKLDKSISRFDTYSDIMSNYVNIVELSGRSMKDSALLIQLSTAMVDNSISKLAGAKEKYDALLASQQSAQENLLRAQGTGDAESIKYWEDTLEDISIKVEETQDEIQQSWSDALSAAADKFDKAVEITVAKLEDALSSFTDLETFSDVYGKAQTEADRFLSVNQKIYELNKLNRDINKTIDNTTNLAAKTKLKEVLEEINKLQSDNVTMSQYDLEYLQAKYNLKVAEIALEEAQNAKNQVRLTRDSEGNWGYTYTADQTKIDEAQQNYEDNLNNLQKLSEDYIKNMSDQIIQNQQDMADALAGIDKNRADYTEEVSRITAYYMKQDLYLRQEMDKAVVNSGIAYSDTILGQIENSDSWQKSHQNMVNNTNAAIATMNAAYIEWKNTVDDVMKAAGTSSNDFTETVKNDLDTISNKSNELEQTLEEDSQNMVSYMDTLMNKVSDWQRTYGTSIQTMIAANEALIASLNKVIAAQGGMSSLSGIDDYSLDMAEEYRANGESARYIQLAKERAAKMAADPSVSNVSNAALLNLLQKAAADPKSDAAKYLQEVMSGKRYFDSSISGFDTGGYTGDWGPNAKLAALHEKEIVLNEADTTNFLKAIEIVRSISSILDQKALLASLGLLNVSAASTLDTSSQTVEQDVTIHAEFPNVTDRNEIEAAFNNLIGTASQYANRK